MNDLEKWFLDREVEDVKLFDKIKDNELKLRGAPSKIHTN